MSVQKCLYKDHVLCILEKSSAMHCTFASLMENTANMATKELVIVLYVIWKLLILHNPSIYTLNTRKVISAEILQTKMTMIKICK